MEEGVGDVKDDKNENNYEVKEAECPYVTPPDDMEEGVGFKKYDKNDRIDEGKGEGETKDSVSTIVNNE